MSTMLPSSPAGERVNWNRHWKDLQEKRAWFGKLASWVRRAILSRAVEHYTETRFATRGIFVEAGCGTGEASSRVRSEGRLLVGLDFSVAALLSARGKPPYRALVGGDLRSLPFRDGSLDGIWNLGVLEHFEPADGNAVLVEMRRTLAAGGVALLFWPPHFGLSRLVLAPIEWLRSAATGRRFRFFPDEVNRMRSRRHGRETLSAAGLQPLAVAFTPHDAFIHLVVIGRKAA
jgi:SAM-dependent methyltransferase